jgi:beta-N-acetylhexosaminidase
VLRSVLATILTLTIALAAPPVKAPVKPPVKKRAPVAVETGPVARWMRTMTLRDEVAQLLVVPFSGRPLNPRTKAYRDFVKLVARDHVGGLILVNVTRGRLVDKAQPMDVAAFLNKMQRLTKVPLLVSGDLERGASMRLDATTVFPHAMAFTAGRDPSAAKFEGEVTAREARAVGIQWVFYPVADVNNNPDNPIINIRSFGENPDDVATYADAFIEGAQEDKKTRVLTTAKHFPGHGDTATDSHMNMATILADRPRLEQMEFAPFRAAIKQGVDAVMTAHIAVPALDNENTPATLSPKILTGILRDEMAFKGLIVTDALEMGGIAKGFSTGEAAVRAIEAGADVLLMPTNPGAAIDGVLAAVKSGRITKKRLDQSVARILAAKVKVGLAVKSTVDLENVHEVLNAPESNARAQEIADHAVTLVKNDRDVVPLRDPSKSCFYILAEGRTSIQGQAFQQEVRRRSPGARVAILDTSMSDGDVAMAEQQMTGCDATVVAAFVSVAAYRGDVALGGAFPDLVNRLIAANNPLALVALGNPYLLRNFIGVNAYMTTYSTVPPSEIAAVKALYGEIGTPGKLPVTIPGLAKYGDGIQLKGK